MVDLLGLMEDFQVVGVVGYCIFRHGLQYWSGFISKMLSVRGCVLLTGIFVFFPSRSIHSKSPVLFSCQARRKRTEFAVFKSGGSTDIILHLRELSRGSRISNELKMDGDVHSVVGALS